MTPCVHALAAEMLAATMRAEPPDVEPQLPTCRFEADHRGPAVQRIDLPRGNGVALTARLSPHVRDRRLFIVSAMDALPACVTCR